MRGCRTPTSAESWHAWRQRTSGQASRGPTAYRIVRKRKRGPGSILSRLESSRCVMQMCRRRVRGVAHWRSTNGVPGGDAVTELRASGPPSSTPGRPGRVQRWLGRPGDRRWSVNLAAQGLTGGRGGETHAEGSEKGTSGLLDPMAGRSGLGRCWRTGQYSRSGTGGGELRWWSTSTRRGDGGGTALGFEGV